MSLIGSLPLPPKEPGMLRMLSAKAEFPRRIVAAFGRDWMGEVPQYVRKAVPAGPSRIALTILLLSDKDTCEVSGMTGKENKNQFSQFEIG